MQGVSELNTVKNKTTIYSNLILKYFLTHEMVTNKQLADEIGLSEKTIRTKIDSINYMLKENNLGTIEKKNSYRNVARVQYFSKSEDTKID